MIARWLVPALLVASTMSCGNQDDSFCEFIGYDLYNTTGRQLKSPR